MLALVTSSLLCRMLGVGLDAAAAEQSPAGHAAAPTRPTGSLPPNFDPCPYPGAPWGWAGKVRPGKASAARRLLGSELRAQVQVPKLGTVDLTFDNKHLDPARRAAVFSDRRRVLAQSASRELHSCHWMLGDKPAAKRLADSADAAVRARHLYIRSAKVRVIEEYVSDNPYDPDTVIVTIRVANGHFDPPTHGGPPIERDDAYTVVENRSTADPSSVTHGGL